jgi:hypothetical protein
MQTPGRGRLLEGSGLFSFPETNNRAQSGYRRLPVAVAAHSKAAGAPNRRLNHCRYRDATRFGSQFYLS